ncbi:MAG TPA: Gp138 family membrane-puncturing spike protein [Beijerinckiaceae bacterium]|jgi:hypothetical protein|nr:Gp138 family membrane-puncturing spike protein [Beijerinckiaceae bacterium]
MAGYQGTGTRFDEHESLGAMIEAERREHNGPMLGKVVAYDAKRQKATIQPLLTQSFDGVKLRAPELQEVPVQVPRAGGLVLHKPLKAGDEVMLHFAGRSMDAAWDDGSDVDRHPGRMSDLSDAYAVPTSTTKSKEMANLPGDRLHIGTDDGQSGFQMKDDGSFDIKKGGDTFLSIFVDFLKAYKDHKHGGVPMDPPDIEKANLLLQRAQAMKAS